MGYNHTWAVLTGLTGLLAGTALYLHDPGHVLDTEGMLAASVSIGTISHVHIDKVGDSVWDAGIGSGILVSSSDCEVWTNHHVVAGAALVEVYPRGRNGAVGIPATVIRSTPRSDIAILRMESCSGIVDQRLAIPTACAKGTRPTR